MNAIPASRRHLQHGAIRLHRRRRALLSASSGAKAYSSSSDLPNTSDKDIEGARAYCLNLMRNYDVPSYTLRPFIPTEAQDAYLALRALNIDVARIADATSNPAVGAMRMQFWRDAITRSLALNPPKEPVAILLSHAAGSLSARTNNTSRLSKSWLHRIVTTREQHLHNPPYPTMASLETYAENTYSTLLYLTLSALPLASITADHIASHLGKAQGIVALLRGLPLLAFPAPPSTHSPQNALGGALQGGRQGSIPLPLETMAEFNVREEAVFREGAAAPGLRDAVFAVATRANDHLITAREMLKNVQAGRDVGHDYEHQDDVEHGRGMAETKTAEGRQKDEVERGFGVFMPAVATQAWLDRLQAADFDVFAPGLRVADWKLPWKSYWAYTRRRL